MIGEYIAGAMRRATYELLPDEGVYFGTVPGFDGAWAAAATLDATRDELEEVLEEWILYRLWAHLPLPDVDGLRLEFKPVGDVD